MIFRYLPVLLAHLAGAVWVEAETVQVEQRGAVDLKPFVCQDITRSSLISRVCYDAANRTMIVQSNAAASQYCGVAAATLDTFLNAPSMGHYYNAKLRGPAWQGRYDCRADRASE
ncbi:KTSC domain-containing protein [uncultured Bradyrhizobium sp.]|uniref:KTSC domain-containing protein n=1 Tax=uncultured Bradyrhizobium sp. TaxID=199684 RepID=UPI0035CC90D2